MTRKLIQETLELITALKQARDSADDPVVRAQYDADIHRLEKLLDRLNKQLEELTKREK